MTAVIVEDEVQSHNVLKKMLSQSHNDVEVAASAFTLHDGIEKVKTHQPDVVFLDVELPDGIGFDLLQHFSEPDFSVVFITAHNRYAVTAIRFGALDFLLKPIEEELLNEALDRVRKKVKQKISEQQLQILFETLTNIQEKKLPSRMSVSTSEGIIYLEIENIIRLEAHQNYTEFYLSDRKKKILVSVNLGEYEKQFEVYDDFLRVHRSHMVNVNYIDRYVKSDGGYLVMKNGDIVPVSRKFRDGLLDFLG